MSRLVTPHMLKAGGGEIVDKIGDMVEALLSRPEHVAIDRALLVMLLDELDLQVAEEAEGV